MLANSGFHTKEFLRKLSETWARVHITVGQPALM